MSSENIHTMSIPEVSLHELALEKLGQYGDAIALIDGPTEVSYTFAEVLTNIRKVASGLARLGVQKGDVVAVYSTNSAEYIFLFYACMANGAVMAQINPRYNRHELADTLELVEATWLYTIARLADRAVSAAKLVKSIKDVICLGDGMDTVPFSQLISDDGEAYPNTTINPREDLALLGCTTGTTGVPKRMTITHHAVVTAFHIFSHPDVSRREGNRVTITVEPFHDCFAVWWNMMRYLLQGHRQIIVPEPDKELLLQTIEKYRVDDLALWPSTIAFMVRSPLASKYDLSSLQNVMLYGAPIREDLGVEFTTRFAPCCIHNSYGTSETGPLTNQYADRPHKAGSVGQAAPLVELQVVDRNTKKVLGPNEMGEILARTDAVMVGYWRKPEATKEKLDKDKWFHTGDMGYYDEDRHFFLVDRYQELIKFKEFRLSPAEIECLIANHPRVSDVGVIGVPDPRAGEVPKAFVVKKADVELTEKEIMDYVIAKVDDSKHLRGGVEFVDTIPRSPAGNPLRRLLRQMNHTDKE